MSSNTKLSSVKVVRQGGRRAMAIRVFEVENVTISDVTIEATGGTERALGFLIRAFSGPTTNIRVNDCRITVQAGALGTSEVEFFSFHSQVDIDPSYKITDVIIRDCELRGGSAQSRGTVFATEVGWVNNLIEGGISSIHTGLRNGVGNFDELFNGFDF